jgi:hypothetical protein
VTHDQAGCVHPRLSREQAQVPRQRRELAIFPPSLADLANAKKKKRIIDLLSSPKFNDPSDEVVAAEPIRSVLGIAKQADVLYAVLENLGYDPQPGSPNFRAVGWDWRKGVDDAVTQQAVENAIHELAAGGKKVVMLPHSTGGLVLRRLLEDKPALVDEIDSVMSFGVPWAGTLAAVKELFAPAGVGLGPFKLVSDAEVGRFMSNAQALYDLCPPDPAKTDMHLADGTALNLFMESNQQASPLLRTAWMKSGAHMQALAQKADQRLGQRSATIQLGGGKTMPPVTNVVGWGVSMSTRCDLDAAGDLQFFDETLGDNTVPFVSASWLRGPNVRTMALPIGAYPTGNIPMRHAHIWDSPPVVQLLKEVLEGAPRRPFIAVAVDGDDFQAPARPTVKVRIVALDETGLPLPKAEAALKLGGGNNPKVKLDRVLNTFEFSRANLNPNVNGTTFFRLPVDVKWQGGSAKEVILFHVT